MFIINLNLSTKEKFLLEDQKTHEQTCIQKYTNYANSVTCPQLKNILNQNAQQEKEHLNTINQLLNGQIPAMNNQQSQQQGMQSQQQSMQSQQQSMQPQMQPKQSISFKSQNSSPMSNGQTTDKDMCTDLLMTEKYVSGAYDTAIFEFTNPQVRSVLNHIQKEEQQHGEAIFKYMQSNGMYTVK